jgi:hypothetical protein
MKLVAFDKLTNLKAFRDEINLLKKLNNDNLNNEFIIKFVAEFNLNPFVSCIITEYCEVYIKILDH